MDIESRKAYATDVSVLDWSELVIHVDILSVVYGVLFEEVSFK